MPRKVTLIHLDGRVVHCPDDGCSRDGQPGQQRQSLEHQLTRRFRSVVVGGETVEVPEWRLHEQPGPFPYADPQAGARDDFDRRVLRGDDGKWRTPTDGWRAASAVVKAKSAARDMEAAQMHNDRIAQRAGEQLAALMQAVNPAPAKKASKGDGA